MGTDIPLLIPEVNPDHTGLIDAQRKNRGWGGYIVANPNCSVIGLVMPLKPLQDAFGLTQVSVVTMQAKSGAGYPGPPPEVIGDNVLPLIRGEEDKVEEEPQKLLGFFARDLEPCPPLVPCLVSAVIDPDIETCCRDLNINFYDLSNGHGLLHDPFDSDIPLP
jgi:aspartate-semialdehyde dehydrogenase